MCVYVSHNGSFFSWKIIGWRKCPLQSYQQFFTNYFRKPYFIIFYTHMYVFIYSYIQKYSYKFKFNILFISFIILKIFLEYIIRNYFIEKYPLQLGLHTAKGEAVRYHNRYRRNDTVFYRYRYRYLVKILELR